MYGAEYFFVDNPLNRYTLSARNDLKKNADGSVDLYVTEVNGWIDGGRARSGRASTDKALAEMLAS